MKERQTLEQLIEATDNLIEKFQQIDDSATLTSYNISVGLQNILHQSGNVKAVEEISEKFLNAVCNPLKRDIKYLKEYVDRLQDEVTKDAVRAIKRLHNDIDKKKRISEAIILNFKSNIANLGGALSNQANALEEVQEMLRAACEEMEENLSAIEEIAESEEYIV